MNLTINGKSSAYDQEITILKIIKLYELDYEQAIVEINKEMIDKKDYETIQLKEGDMIELIVFMGGGS